MAKFEINTKSKDYVKNKEAFLRELKQFNESKSISNKTPAVNGIDIDLFLFYSLVQQRGGLNKVNQLDAWDAFLRPLKLPFPCINGSTLLRKIYAIYLEKFDRAKGPPGRDDDLDLDEDPRRGRGGGSQRANLGGAYISASGEHLRTGSRPVAGPSERLALSLISPLPNEQDFAVNVCTVLAADHSNRLPLSSTPHILDFLLAHAGVYNHSSLRDTIGRSYYEARGKYPDEFWQQRAGGGGARELADETKFMALGIEPPDLMVQAMASHNKLTDRLYTGEDDPEVGDKVVDEDVFEEWVSEPSEEDQLFAPELPGGAKCVYTQRILQIASIVRSLSFHEENVQFLAKNNTLIRFLLLCANCWVGTLRQSGLDTLGNICTELIVKEPATCLLSRHILSTIQASLVSPDRSRVLAALEMLNKLSQNEANEEVLLKALDNKVYNDVCAMLTVRDIMLLVCSLECVYALTSLGERACERVARITGLVRTLVSLTTVEAQSYGPRACILMRVVETVSGPSALAAAAEQQAALQAPPQPHHPSSHSNQPQTAVKQAAEPRPAPQPVSQPQPSPAPVSTIQQAHNQQRTVQENEQFALAWLRASYAPLPPSDNSGCDAAELYRQYMHCCTKLNRKGVIAPQHFPRLVRTVFGGTVGPNSVTTATGETMQMYIGIKARNQPAKSNTPSGPSSPILKAQLTNKAATVEVKTVVPPTQVQQGSSHPHLSQALDTGASSTSLIKHLLAHKVSPAQPNVQVTQRQQSQQRVGPVSTGSGVTQPNSVSMDVDPEALIKCTTIIPGGVASTTPGALEKVLLGAGEEAMMTKDEPVQIQIDEQSQLTIKSAQNKMLADLLEKKSNPPVQVVQMSTNQMNAPTIQITETGQIVQVKSEPLIQINADSGQIVTQSGPYYQIKNEAGQVIQLKNEQGQIIQLKTEQPVIRNDVDTVVADHSYTEPPTKKLKQQEEKREKSPQESVSKTAANLYAALAASALEDEEDLMPPKQDTVDPQSILVGTESAPVIIQEPLLQVQQPTMQVQQPTLQVQQSTLHVHQPTMQVQQPTLQVQQQVGLQMPQNTIQVAQQTLQMQQPMLQVQPMDVQNIIASQSGQLILQDKSLATQQTQYVQQPMQIIATPSNAQGGISYLAQNIPGNMMQKTIIIVQGATGGGPITLTVNNPGGLDEATLNSVIAQATEAITQQQIIQNSGVIQSGQRVIVSQPTLLSVSQPMTMVKATLTQNSPQLTASQQPIITSQPQPHKAQIMNTQQQMVVTQKNPPALISSSANQQMITNQQVMQGNQQLITSQQVITNNQQVMQGNQQLTQQVLQNNQQMIMNTQQVTQNTQQIIQGSQQLMQGNQQIISVSNNQQPLIVNAPMKGPAQRMMPPQRMQTAVSDANTNALQATSTANTAQPVMRQVIRQPVMMGGTKIGEKEVLVTQPITEVPQLVPAKSTTPTPMASPAVPKQVEPAPVAMPAPEENPWICHWRGCGKLFESAASVFKHAARTHCPQNAQGEAPCLWLDCDRVPRKTFALLNHINDRHCTADALKAVFNSRRHIAAEAENNKPVSLGYPPNAALAALNKHAAEFLNPRELMDENEGPVTKSIRLTAALILRNLVIYSNTGRRLLRSYEAHLATIALSNVEASRTIAQVLYDMNNI